MGKYRFKSSGNAFAERLQDVGYVQSQPGSGQISWLVTMLKTMVNVAQQIELRVSLKIL